jgi:hypothetical protein
VVLIQILVEVWIAKAILMRSLKETRNMVLKMRIMPSLSDANNLVELCPCHRTLWKADVKRMVEDFSNQNIEGVVWFLLIAYNKM